ncbi:MAG: sterol desaturase family protein [candidate division KSB1 bacterium]|nr:sterol desaturase family protein [candidate division KSB1 bacterium]
MLNVLWNTRGYFFWLLVVSLLCWVLERLAPWRPEQKPFRKQIWQDFFWLIFNGHYAGIAIAFAGSWVIQQLNPLFGLLHVPSPESIALLSGSPLWLQFIVFFVLKDFLEYFVHNLLHRLPLLWEFHKLHHSIEELDWIGNMRFHWMEIVVYKSVTYLPLVMLGVNGQVILWIAVVSTLIGHLNHSNLNFDWGPLRYVINSPRMHVWHHDVVLHGRYGQNFGVVLCLWDWLFGTAYLPARSGQPQRLGFEGMEKFPTGLLPRLIYPFSKKKPR